ncbi:protein FANTASTIC FOUR 2-like [Primulina eburnea]|uniref:protein FANTASTIC FOUR 2-like n=1 Tax=Primulina eburnea TaxID=1245227 RepID=UPI003C6C06DD
MSSTSSVLVQKLAPGKPEFSSPCHSEKSGQNSSTVWDFIQSLTKDSRNFTQLTDDSEQVYVQPLVKNSASSLSLKSLEMCTESLGSETGSNIDSDIDDFSSVSFDKRNHDDKSPPRTEESSEKVKHSTSFPPPLTSMSRSDFVQVKTRREEGRLVIKALCVSSWSPYFRAERLNGRLRLSLLHNGSWESEDERDENEEQVDEEDADEQDLEKNDDENGYKGCFRGENLEENGAKIECGMGGGELSCCRCHGDGNGSKRLRSLPLSMAIS